MLPLARPGSGSLTQRVSGGCWVWQDAGQGLLHLKGQSRDHPSPRSGSPMVALTWGAPQGICGNVWGRF